MQKTRFVSFGGETSGKCLLKILKSLFTDEVLSQYSWEGVMSKKAFKAMDVNDVIIESIRVRFPEYTIAEFVKNMHKYFKTLQRTVENDE